MNAVVMQAELALQDILNEHEELLGQARGFGMRTAAIPRGLMPLKEAQGVVAKFDDNTRKLKGFLDSLGQTQVHAPDKATRDALGEIYDRGAKSLRKFEDDLTKAKAALAKHEDLLVGENFQDMFQALRLAVLDLDLTDKADFGAKTHLYLDATPAYAVGVASVWRIDPKEEVYKVRATYKAETDEYIADMWSMKSNRWFPAAKKTGHARISAFVKAVVDKLKAVHDLEGESLIESRRTVEDTSKEVAGYKGEIDARIQREKAQAEYKQAEKISADISQAIDRKLSARLPGSRTSRYPSRRDTSTTRVTTWNAISVGNTTVQVATNVRIDPTGTAHIFGHYGLRSDSTLSKVVPKTAFGESFETYVDAAVDAVASFITASTTPTRAPAPVSAPAQDTPHIRAVLRGLRGLEIEYPGTLGAAAETEINKVLTGAVPSITLSTTKLSQVENPTDPVAVAIQARAFQAQYHGGTTQVGNITITQTVALKYRAQIVNLLLTIPSKDARLPGPTDSSVDLAGSIKEYFARGSKGSLPALVRSLIADVTVTITRQGAVGRTAGTTRTAGAADFENMVWIPNVREAFDSVHQDELAEHGHRDGYPGTIAAKSGYAIRVRDPMTERQAHEYVRKDISNNGKWDRNAFAIPVTKERVLATDKITVTVTARDEKEALRQAKMRIYATGRFPPNATAVVSDLVPKKISETARTKTFEVTGTRKVVMADTTDGWLFYGVAPY